MANSYYNYDGDLIPGTRAASLELDNEFAAIAAGFDQLGDPSQLNTGANINGDDTGNVDAYVVDNGGSSTLVAGQLVTFIPTNTSTGPSTLSLNGSSNAAIVRNDGTALQAGDLIQDVPVMLIWDGTQWTLVGATAAQARGRPSIKSVTGAYTLTADDEGYVIICSNATITAPTGLPVGMIVHLYRFTADELTVSAGAGAVLRNAIGNQARAQYSTVSLVQTAVGEWLLIGDAK
jgi:hypothetical protein